MELVFLLKKKKEKKNEKKPVFKNMEWSILHKIKI